MRTQLKTKIIFDTGLTHDKKLLTMKKLNEYLMTRKLKRLDFSLLDETDLIIGNYYSINDNGSVQIPWNWFENE